MSRLKGELERELSQLSLAEARELAEFLRKKFGIRSGNGAEAPMPSDAPLHVPKAPRLLQQSIDDLIAKGKAAGLTAEEQARLDEALDYLDDLTLLELDRLTRLPSQ